MFKKLGAFGIVASVALIALTGAGLWAGFPIIGGASYCASTVNNVCVSTIPAGPAKTGNELVPTDTQAPNGQSPQSAYLSMADLNALPYTYQLVVTGSPFYTYTVPNNVGTVIFDIASGAISDERVTAPAAPVDGQRVKVNSVKTITAFQFIANTGQSLAATTPTVITASTTSPQGYEWVYDAALTKWLRIQ